jgi:O-antigen biosynthesis protein
MTGATRWNFSATDALAVRDWLRASHSAGATARQQEIRAKGSRELRLMKRSDVTLVVSPTELELLQRLVPTAHVAVVSNVHDFSSSGRKPEGCASRRGLLFVGNFNHPPNQQAVRALLEDVLPEASRILAGGGGGAFGGAAGASAVEEELVLHIVGSNRGLDVDPATLSAAGGAKIAVQFHGWLSDVELELLYRSVKLVVAPLMSGAGVKGKINQAMLYGVPVVATPIAAEGMHLVDGVNCMLASTAREFAEKLAAAYRDCELWERLVRGGFKNLEDFFSVPAATRHMEAVLLQLGFQVPPPPGAYACRRPPAPPPAPPPP